MCGVSWQVTIPTRNSPGRIPAGKRPARVGVGTREPTETQMPEQKGSRSRSGNSRAPEPKSVTTDLIPANPLSAGRAFLQVALLFGIPLVLLILARFFLRQYFPSLGY
jgi:hypothetical protein